MDKKPFDSLNESVKEKLRNCKSDAEMQKIIAEAGLQELSVDVLEGVSGGGCDGPERGVEREEARHQGRRVEQQGGRVPFCEPGWQRAAEQLLWLRIPRGLSSGAGAVGCA